jgi:hypothetical protein
MTSALIIGLEPRVLERDEARGVTPELIARGLEEALADMRSRGWTADFCGILPDDSLEAAIGEALRRQPWDVVVIGAGVRLPPQNLHLLERVVNAVHHGAPGARIAFNTTPADSATAAQRWVGKASS